MYIHKIKLTNIRGFKSLDFDLQRPDPSKPYAGWTVFTGDNGSGKSTMLKAIAMCLIGADTARALQPNLNGWVRYGTARKTGDVHLEISKTSDDPPLVGAGRNPGKIFNARIQFENGSKQTVVRSAIPEGRPKTYVAPERTIWSANRSGWFSCGYGPFRRVFGGSQEAATLMATPSTARYATMFLEAATLFEADKWLRELHYKSLEKRASETRQLDQLIQLLNDDFMPNGIQVDHVDSEGLWLKDRNGIRLSWGDMSDGYRAAIALLVDIVRQLTDTFHPRDVIQTREGDKPFIPCSGVVMIDEVDAHLHPEWQREIGYWLTSHFPNIQFIVTTHSPLICQAADRNGLFVLPEPGSDQLPRPMNDDEYRKIVSSRPDTILLTAAFGLQNTRSPVVVQARAEYARLVAMRRAVPKLPPAEQKRMTELEPLVLNVEEL